MAAARHATTRLPRTGRPRRAARLPLLGLLLYASPLLAITEITSLPFVCSMPGETYVLAGDLALDSGAAITVAADDVTIDGNGRTLTYARTGAGHGIVIAYRVTRLEIHRLTLVQGDYEPVAGDRVHAISRNGDFYRTNIHDNTIHVRHGGAERNAHGHAISLVNNSAATREVIIARNTITVAGTSAGHGVALDNGKARIHDNAIRMVGLKSAPAGYSRAIAVSGRGPIEIFNNHIDLDAGSDTIQGISLWGAHRVAVHHNRIDSAASHARAILVDGNSDNNRIYHNRITLSARHNGEDASAGIRIRFGSDHNRVYANTIDAARASNAFAIRLGGEDTRNGRFPDLAPPTGTLLYDNVLTSSSRAVSLEDNAGNTQFYRNRITAAGQGATAVYVNGDFEDITFSHDRIAGPVRFQEGSSSTLFCGTTVKAAQIRNTAGRHRYRILGENCPIPDDADSAPPAGDNEGAGND